MKRLSLVFVALSFLLFSCGDTLDEIVSAGQFNSKISGDVVKDFNGVAAFTHAITTQAVSGADGSSLLIGLSDIPGSSEAISLSILETGNKSGITTGTYNYNSTSGPVFAPGYGNGLDIWLADESLTNSITISKVSDKQVKGEFTLNLIDTKGLQSINITGTFDALGTTTTN